MGAFFRDGNEYLAMDVWLKEGTSVSLLLQGEGNVWQADTVTLTAGSEIPANVIVIDADGKRVSLIESGKWYRVYFHLVYNHDYNKAKGWSDCYMTVGGAEAEAYVGNVEYYKDFTAPAFAE